MTPTLFIAPDGDVCAVHTDAIDLGALGRRTMRRVSRVEFDEDAQLWRVFKPHGRTCLFSDPSRQKCVDWEVDMVTAQIHDHFFFSRNPKVPAIKPAA